MRIAIISDIHGNAAALQTVLHDIKDRNVGRIVCLGDVVFGGPQPAECIDLLQALDAPMVKGNTDDLILRAAAGEIQGHEPNADVARWGARQLSDEQIDFLRSFQPTVELPLDGDDVLLCFHGTPDSHTGMILPDMSTHDIAAAVGEQRAAVLSGGHVHWQFALPLPHALFVNPGTVGLPLHPPLPLERSRGIRHAEYALLDWLSGDITVTLRRVPLEIDAIRRLGFEIGMPHPESWAEHWV